jgi:predicted dehydrogenase
VFIKERQKVDSDEWAPVTTDDYTNIMADLSSGATATIELSRCAKTEEQLVEFIIYGEKGYIRFCNYVGEGLEICYGDKDAIAQGKGGVTLAVNVEDLDLAREVKAPVTVVFTGEYSGKVYEIFPNGEPYTVTVSGGSND